MITVEPRHKDYAWNPKPTIRRTSWKTAIGGIWGVGMFLINYSAGIFCFSADFLYRAVGRFQEKRFHPQFSYVEFPALVTFLLTAPSKLEAVLLKFIRFPIGSSVLILTRKVR